MSQDFKFNLWDDPKQPPKAETDGITYNAPGHGRNLCFEWPDGRKKFLNYAYLISAEINDGSINVMFSTETVVISGTGLDTLFEQLMNQTQRRVSIQNDRYASLSNDPYSIKTITIQQNN